MSARQYPETPAFEETKSVDPDLDRKHSDSDRDERSSPRPVYRKSSEEPESLIMHTKDWEGFKIPDDVNRNTGHAVFFAYHPKLKKKVVVKLNKQGAAAASVQEGCAGVVVGELSADSPEEARVEPTYLLVKNDEIIGVVVPMIENFKDYTDVNLNSVIANIQAGHRGEYSQNVDGYINEHEKITDAERDRVVALYAPYEREMAQYKQAKKQYDETRIGEEPKVPKKPKISKEDEYKYRMIKALPLRKNIHAYFADSTLCADIPIERPEYSLFHNKYEALPPSQQPTTLGELRQIEAYEKQMEYVFLRYLLGEDDGHKGNYGFTFDEEKQELTIRIIDFDQALYSDIAARYANLRRKNQLWQSPYGKHDFVGNDIHAFPILDGNGANPGFHPGQVTEGWKRGIIWTPNKGKYTQKDFNALQYLSLNEKFKAAALRAKTKVAKHFLAQDPHALYQRLLDMSPENLSRMGVDLDKFKHGRVDFARAYVNGFMRRRQQFVREVTKSREKINDREYQRFADAVNEADQNFRRNVSLRSAERKRVRDEALSKTTAIQRNIQGIKSEIEQKKKAIEATCGSSTVESRRANKEAVNEAIAHLSATLEQLEYTLKERMERAKQELLPLVYESLAEDLFANGATPTSAALKERVDKEFNDYKDFGFSRGDFIDYAMTQISWSLDFDAKDEDHLDSEKRRKDRGILVLEAIIGDISTPKDFENLMSWFKRAKYQSSFITDVRRPSFFAIYFTNSSHHNRYTQTYATMRDMLLNRALQLQSKNPENPIYTQAIHDLEEVGSWRTAPSKRKQRLTFANHFRLKFRQYFLHSNAPLTWENWKKSKVDFLQKGMLSATGVFGLLLNSVLIIKDIPAFLMGGIAISVDEVGHSIISKCLSVWHDNPKLRPLIAVPLLIATTLGMALRITGNAIKLGCNLIFNPLKTAEAAQAWFDRLSQKAETAFERLTDFFKRASGFSPKGVVAALFFLISAILTWLVVKPITWAGRGLKIPNLISLLLTGVALFFAAKAILAGIGLLGAASFVATVTHAITVAGGTLYSFAAAHLPFLVTFDLHLFGAHIGALMTSILVAILPFQLNEISKKPIEYMMDTFSGSQQEEEHRQSGDKIGNSQADIARQLQSLEAQKATREFDDLFKAKLETAKAADEDSKSEHKEGVAEQRPLLPIERTVGVSTLKTVQDYITVFNYAVGDFIERESSGLDALKLKTICDHLLAFAEKTLPQLADRNSLKEGATQLSDCVTKLLSKVAPDSTKLAAPIIAKLVERISALKTERESELTHSSSKTAPASHISHVENEHKQQEEPQRTSLEV